MSDYSHFRVLMDYCVVPLVSKESMSPWDLFQLSESVPSSETSYLSSSSSSDLLRSEKLGVKRVNVSFG